MRRDRALASHGSITGEEDFNYFLSILYPASNLQIMDYNRVLKSLNGLTQNEFLEKMRAKGI
jgi:uncharacterized protein (DUF1015 family)